MQVLFISVILLFTIGFLHVASAQCDPSVPSFTVNLSGNPDSLWTSPGVVRNGNCCGTSSPDVCIHFYLTLDSGSAGIIFDVSGGAGATSYSINCTTTAYTHTAVCLSGVGPWNIDFCKPGSNTQTYTIKSIPKPTLKRKKVYITSRCNPSLIVENLIESTIKWKSLSGSQYDSNLSCKSGCDTVFVNFTGNFPSFVDYQVCGSSILPCYSGTYCDTVRVYKVIPVSVMITPDPAIICTGYSNISITANPYNGVTPYNYLWSTGATTKSINAVPGIYWVRVTDFLNCSPAYDTIIVYNASQIVVDAGKDTAVCITVPSVNLNGFVKVASGGQWSGGSGTYAPDNKTLNATYTFSAAEKAAGFAKLHLTSTGNGSCSAIIDSVLIRINPLPSATTIASRGLCIGSSISIGAPPVAGSTYSWTSSPAGFNSTSANPTISPTITTTYTVTETSANGCIKSNAVTIAVDALPSPSISGNFAPCEFTDGTYVTANFSGHTYSWTVSGGTIISGQGTNAITVKWGITGTGQLTLTETDPVTGCSKTVSVAITINPRPGAKAIHH